MKFPKVINIGSGKDFREDCLNIDNEIRWKPDILHDLNKPLLRSDSQIKYAGRFGEIEIVKGTFKRIIAKDVLEHINNLVVCMKSCLELLEENGTMEILVPYDLSLGAWQDPTHVRAFNENSWRYYNEWCWYLGWEKEIFELTAMEYNLSDYGKGLFDIGEVYKTILNTPRAADSMRVKLKKKTLG